MCVEMWCIMGKTRDIKRKKKTKTYLYIEHKVKKGKKDEKMNFKKII